MRKLILFLLLLPSLVLAQPFGGDRIKVWDGADVAQCEAGSTWASGHSAASMGMDVNSRNMQLWPSTGKRAGVAGDDNYYGQLMNDLGDLVVSLGSITTSTTSTQITSGAGNSSAGTLRVVIASNQVAIPVTDNSGSLTVDGTVACTQSGTWDEIGINDSGNSITVDGSVTVTGTVTANPGELLWLAKTTNDIDNSAIQVFDTDTANSSTKFIQLTNAGDGDLYCIINDTTPVADGSTADYSWKLAKGQMEWIPVGFRAATSTINDIYCIRAAAQTNDNVIVQYYGWAN